MKHDGMALVLAIKQTPYFYQLIGEILQSIPNTPYLGVTLSTDLKFNIHLNINVAKSLPVRRNLTYVSTAVRIDPKSALSFAATSVQSAFHFKFTYSRLVRDLIKSMSLFRMALVSNQSGSLFYDYFTT